MVMWSWAKPSHVETPVSHALPPPHSDFECFRGLSTLSKHRQSLSLDANRPHVAGRGRWQQSTSHLLMVCYLVLVSRASGDAHAPLSFSSQSHDSRVERPAYKKHPEHAASAGSSPVRSFPSLSIP